MIRRRQFRRSAAIAAALLAVPGGAGSQTISDQLEVRVIELEVAVRDRQGREIGGLTRDSFTVSLGGVPLEVSNFRAVTPAAATAARSAVAGSVQEPEPRHLALYFDETSLDGAGRAKLARRLASSLPEMLAPGARIMVAGRRGFELGIYQPFTELPGKVGPAIATALRSAPRNDAKDDLSELLREVERSISAVEDAPHASARARARVLAARSSSFVSEALQRLARGAEVFEQLARLLGALPGRKAVLYVGEGLAVHPGEVLGSALRDAFGRFELSSMSEFIDSTSAASSGSGRLEDVVESAESRGLVVYAVDTAGASAPSVATAELRSIDVGRSGGSAPTDTWTPGISSRRRAEQRSALATVALATGGKVLTSSRRDTVGAVLGDLGSYYSLGVQVPASATSLDALEVSVEGRGRDLHFRRSGRERSRDQVDSDRTVAALLDPRDAAQQPAGAALEASLTLGEITPTSETDCVVALAISVPVAAIKVAARDRLHEGQISIFVVTRGAERRVSAVRKIVLPVSLDESELATAVGRRAEYRMELSLPPGPASIAVGVRDDLDEGLTLLREEVEVDPTAVSPSS